MTVSSSNNRLSYNGDGGSINFATPYFLANADIKVYVGGVLQTLTTHYSLSGAGTESGGTCTFVSAPAIGTGNVVILRDPDQLQSTDLPSNDPFPSSSVERALDKLTMLVQRCRDLLGRSFTLPDSDTSGASLTVPTPAAAKFIRWNASATGLENADVTVYGSIGVPISIADGGTSAMTDSGARAALGVPYASTSQVSTGTDDASVVTPAKLREAVVGTMEGDVLGNLALSAVTAAGVLTLSVKGADGNDPSATNPVFIGFRKSTGDIDVRTITAPLSLSIPAGATMGFDAAAPCRLWVLAIDNAGTVELAVQNCAVNTGSGVYYLYAIGTTSPVSTQPEARVTTTTAMSTAADGFIPYSANARTSVPFAVLGSYDSTETTPGTWAYAGTLDVNPDYRPGDMRSVQWAPAGFDFNTTTDQIPDDNSIPQIGEGKTCFTFSGHARPYPRCGPDFIEVEAHVPISAAAAATVIGALFRDGGANAVAVDRAVFTAAGQSDTLHFRYLCKRGSYALAVFTLNYGASSAVVVTVAGVASAQKFAGAWAGQVTVRCISA